MLAICFLLTWCCCPRSGYADTLLLSLFVFLIHIHHHTHTQSDGLEYTAFIDWATSTNGNDAEIERQFIRIAVWLKKSWSVVCACLCVWGKERAWKEYVQFSVLKQKAVLKLFKLNKISSPKCNVFTILMTCVTSKQCMSDLKE